MPIRETLNAKPVSLADVLSNGKRYRIPAFQRDYAWDRTEWEELWADILALKTSTDSDSRHYLGALVLQPSGKRSEHFIIDGQQRLVTLSLLALAFVLRIQRLADQGSAPEDNKERVRLLRERFVSTKDASSLQHHPRLVLNAVDDPIYRTYLVQGLRPPFIRNLSASQRRLLDALDFFVLQIEQLFGPVPSVSPPRTGEPDGGALATFLEQVIAERLQFIEIVVNDEETAFTVFETLNARGVALGTADLLKNYLFAQANKGGPADLEQAQALWQQTLAFVPMEHLSTMLFHKLAAQIDNLREKRVYGEIKQIVPEKRGVFDFLHDMAETAQLYDALGDSKSEIWADFPNSRRPVQLLADLKVEQCRPLILAAYKVLEKRPARLVQFLEYILTISVRTIITRRNTGDVQRVYHDAARRVFRGELKSPLSIARALGELYGDDNEFEKFFSELSLNPKGPRKHLVRYILSNLEEALGGQFIDWDAGEVTVEHILPENPGTAWPDFSHEEQVQGCFRLGNLIPLEREPNKKLGSADYATKRSAYGQSKFRLAQHDWPEEWSPGAIRARQNNLAEHAVKIWRIDLTRPEDER